MPLLNLQLNLNYYKHIILLSFILLSACSNGVWNNPYPKAEQDKNILYSAFSSRPKYLDPARSYSSNEWIFVQSIYDSPLQYHYLKRPYTLEENIARKMPEIIFYNKNNQILPKDTTEKIHHSVYIIDLKPNIFYQPHPAFVPENSTLNQKQLASIYTLGDFKKTTTREAIAADFVYQIKRLAHPGLHSPIFSVMKDYIMGIEEFAVLLNKYYKKNNFLDLTKYHLPGVQVLSRYQYKITIKGHQPQFLYWLAMPFFTAMPEEAIKFYAQKGLLKKNISLDWYPVGTSAFYLMVNDPNKEMILTRNPNFHAQYYPEVGVLIDEKNNLLADKGKRLPFVDKIHFSLETESTPYWNKFLQGYYDRVIVGSDHFDSALKVETKGELALSDTMQERDIKLLEDESASIYYTSFNMLDEIVGGMSERARKLRQAIAIAFDSESYISIFASGRGEVAHEPIPKGIFGYTGRINEVIYESKNNGILKSRSLEQAKKLLSEAGYTNGIDEKTNKQLTLSFDTTDIGPEAAARLSWIKKQFDKLDINLLIKATNYSTFQEKMRRGEAQLFEIGWNADYPDPENFLFLFYSKNGKVKHGGDNASNYHNEYFDRLFEKMKNMENTPERQAIIDKMIKIWQRDTPWAFGYMPKRSILLHDWIGNVKPNAMARNTLKYQKVDIEKRSIYRQKYNQVVYTPLLVILILFTLIVLYHFRASVLHFFKHLIKDVQSKINPK